MPGRRPAPARRPPPQALLVLVAGAVVEFGPGFRWLAEATSPAPLAVAKVAFGGAGSPGQAGFVLIDAGARRSFTSSFTLGLRTVAIEASGYEAMVVEPLGLDPDAADAALSGLLRSSLLCTSPCSLEVKLGNLAPGARYKVLSYHHSTGDPRGGCLFTLQYSGNNRVPLKQHGDGRGPPVVLRYDETVVADSLGGVTLTLVKSAISASAPMNLNGLIIEEVGLHHAVLVEENASCGAFDHKDFGTDLTLQECADVANGDLDCSDHFSWCPLQRGQCSCATGVGSSPNCSGSGSGTGAAGCNVYRVEAGALSGPDDCLPGHFDPDGSGNCQQCNGGATRRRRASSCTPCMRGHWDPGNFDDCDRCEGGSVRRRRAQACSPCSAGFFDGADEDECRRCLGGAVRRRRAKTCEECRAGAYDAGDADDCATCHGGHTRRRRSLACIPCPAGYFSAAGEDDCLLTPASAPGSEL